MWSLLRFELKFGLKLRASCGMIRIAMQNVEIAVFAPNDLAPFPFVNLERTAQEITDKESRRKGRFV